MAIATPPYFKWRDGRPRWEPGPKLRAKGWKGRDLKDDAGAWLDLGRAITAAEVINADVARGGRPRAATGTRRARTCRQLYEMWTATPEFSLLRASTRADYRSKAELFLSTPLGDGDTWSHVPVAAIGRAALKGYWREAYQQRGHAMANAILAVVRAMLTHATDLEWIPINPAFALKLPGVAPRQKLWLPADVAALVAAADRLALPEIGDAAIVALHSGQRQADVLALPARLFGESRIRLSQFKRAARIDAPMTPQLIERIAAIRARRASNVVQLDAPLITDADGRPYAGDDGSRFRKAFAAVRTAAMAARPEIAGLTFQDLRDTAVTRLALAECTLAEISAITGHSIVSVTGIIRHYLVLQPEMADAAIGKLTTWLDKEGITL